jgi:hypothetical protein
VSAPDFGAVLADITAERVTTAEAIAAIVREQRLSIEEAVTDAGYSHFPEARSIETLAGVWRDLLKNNAHMPSHQYAMASIADAISELRSELS